MPLNINLSIITQIVLAAGIIALCTLAWRLSVASEIQANKLLGLTERMVVLFELQDKFNTETSDRLDAIEEKVEK